MWDFKDGGSDPNKENRIVWPTFRSNRLSNLDKEGVGRQYGEFFAFLGYMAMED